MRSELPAVDVPVPLLIVVEGPIIKNRYERKILLECHVYRNGVQQLHVILHDIISHSKP